MDKLENRTGRRTLTVLFIAFAILGLAGCSGNDAETMSSAEIDKLIAPVGKLNTGAPVSVEGQPSVPAPAGGNTPPPADNTPVTPDAPAAPVTPPPAPPAPSAARSGKQVYDTTCFACHGTGAAGAPKLGDKAAWAGRIAQGMDKMVSNAINGFQGQTGVMPPRGTCGNCSDDELKAAVTYMADNSK